MNDRGGTGLPAGQSSLIEISPPGLSGQAEIRPAAKTRGVAESYYVSCRYVSCRYVSCHCVQNSKKQT
jgi:hypothetical protein